MDAIYVDHCLHESYYFGTLLPKTTLLFVHSSFTSLQLARKYLPVVILLKVLVFGYSTGARHNFLPSLPCLLKLQ
jgi:hypothetical protein